MAAERVECVDKTAFYEAVDVLKSQQKNKAISNNIVCGRKVLQQGKAVPQIDN